MADIGELANEALADNGIVIADATFGGTSHICRDLYDCKRPSQFPTSKLKKAVETTSKGRCIANPSNTYMPPSPIIELKECLKNINRCLEHHCNENSRFRRNKKGAKRGKRDYYEEDEADNQENINLLGIIAKNLACSIKIFENKTMLTSDEEKIFREMVKELKTLKYYGKPLKINYGERYGTNFFKSWQPLNLDSDEEIVASAIISANKSRTTVISDDSDIKRILAVALRSPEFYEKFWQIFPRNQIRLFADYKKTGNFTLEYDSDNPALCRLILRQIENSPASED